MKRSNLDEIKYPRRQFARGTLRSLTYLAFAALTRLQVSGRENIPESGPLLVVANHFSFVDPVAVIRATPWTLEFVGGFVNPGAPPWTKALPRLWGFYPVFRGTGSRYALLAAERVLNQNGVLGIFPEGGSWAAVLRPPRPGAAYLAARTGARLLPIGLDGFTEVFPSLEKFKQARVTVRIGKPFGPFSVTGRGRERRQQLDEIGHEIMHHIAELIPPERRGHYSDDPAIREAAKGTEIYPWENMVETDLKSGEHLKD